MKLRNPIQYKLNIRQTEPQWNQKLSIQFPILIDNCAESCYNYHNDPLIMLLIISWKKVILYKCSVSTSCCQNRKSWGRMAAAAHSSERYCKRDRISDFTFSRWFNWKPCRNIIWFVSENGCLSCGCSWYWKGNRIVSDQDHLKSAAMPQQIDCWWRISASLCGTECHTAQPCRRSDTEIIRLRWFCRWDRRSTSW